MTLHCTEEEQHELLVKHVINLKLINDDVYKTINVISPVTEEIFTITINADTIHSFEDKSKQLEEPNILDTDTSHFSINDWWRLFLSRVPSNIEHGIWTKDNANTGRRILRYYKEGEDVFKLNIDVNRISGKQMLIAYAYDLYCHRIDSKDENKLKYMLSLDNWLVNTHRIEELFKEACKDLTFLEYYTKDPIIVEQGSKLNVFTSKNKAAEEEDEYEY